MQASLTAMKFRNCKPHYLWLPLRRRIGDKEQSVGELHLRIQWTSDELEKPQEALPSWALDVQLRGVGLSVIEAKMLNFPREVGKLESDSDAWATLIIANLKGMSANNGKRGYSPSNKPWLCSL